MNKMMKIAGVAALAIVGCQTAIKSTESAIAKWKDTRCEAKVLKSSVEDKDIAKSIETLAVVPYGLYQSVIALVDTVAPDENIRPEYAYFMQCVDEASKEGKEFDESLMKEIGKKITDKFGADALKRIKKYAVELKRKNADGTFAKLQAEQAGLQEKVSAAMADVSQRSTAILATIQKVKGNPLYVAGQVAKAKNDLAAITKQLSDAGKGLTLAGALIVLEIGDATAKVSIKVGKGMVKAGKVVIAGVEYAVDATTGTVNMLATDLVIECCQTNGVVSEL